MQKTCRSSSVFPEKLGKVNKRSLHFRLVKGYQISFLSEPSQTAPPSVVSMSQEEIAIVDQEIQEMLKKGAIKLVQYNTKNQFLSSIFIVPKKDSGHIPRTSTFLISISEWRVFFS